MNAERLTKVLKDLIRQPWAVFIWGSPGIGKSSVVRQVAADLDLPVVDLRASLLDPTDLRGIPIVKDGQAQWCPPVFLPKPKDKPGILFLDELNAAPPLVQAGLYQLVLDRRVGEYVLPDGWTIIAAGNRMSDRAVTFRLSSALSNRFVHLKLEADHATWIDWAQTHNLHPLVVAFIRFRPALLVTEPTDQTAFTTPRTWEMLSDVINAMGSVAAAQDFISGVIGEEASIEFLAFARNAMALHDIEAIIRDPDHAHIPEALDQLWVLVSYLIAHGKEPNVVNASAQLLNRLPPEFSVVLGKGLLSVNSKFMLNKHFQDFMREHVDFFR